MPAMSRPLTIINRLGLHARAAAKLVALAGRFAAEIELSYSGRQVNAKSIMGVMMLAAAKGAEVTFHADGDDAAEALDAIEKLLAARFDEPE